MTSNPQILKSSNPQIPQIPQILLIRLRPIGDVVFTTPAIGAVRARFPDARIDYVVEPAAYPIVEHNPHLNDVIVAPRQRGWAGLRSEAALIRRLRRTRYDIAIDFHGGPRASLLTWLSGAKRRIGYDVVARGWMYTERVARARTLRPRHSVENQFDLLAPLGIGPADRNAQPIEIAVDPQAATTLAARLEAAGVEPQHQLIVVHVSSSSPFRRWPPQSFAAAIAALAETDATRRVIVTSGPSEHDAVDRIVGAARSRLAGAAADRILRCGEFSLPELRALVEVAAVYIGGDSGPLHIAAASRVPIVGLYGPTLPARSQPWRADPAPSAAVDGGALPCRPCDQRVCAPGDFRCLTGIAPERVVAAAEDLLAVRA
jgi:predicted lipopolysaccharide heptosyltransferase III